MRAMTWDDIAEFYKKKTNGTARTKSMDSIYKWAIEQDEIVVINKDGELSLKDLDF